MEPKPMSRTLVSIAVLSMLTSQVRAAEPGAGPSLGVGVGAANIDFDRGFGASDTAVSAFASYQFNRYLGIEAGYVHAGAAEDSGVTVEASYASVVGVASWPLSSRWSIFARGGAVMGTWQSAGIERQDTTFIAGAGTALGFGRFQLRLIGDTAKIEGARIVHMSLQGAWKL